MSIIQGGKVIAGSVGQYPLNEKNITNCITYIPQDIKLELNNGTLTLKAGSKVYVPNGVGVFDEVVIASDLTMTSTSNEQNLVFLFNGGLDSMPMKQCFSGSSAPSAYQYMFWYDTTNNLVKFTNDTGSTWTANSNSLPLGLVTASSSAITSIDQVFNGFGYIGSTVFVLPGVKGLIPDGRNADGSLKNITTNDFTTVKTLQVNTSTAKIAMYSGGGLGSQTKNFGLYEPENYNYDNDVLTKALEVARVIVDSSAKITAFTPKTAFHAVDYNDTEYIAHQAMPSDRYVDLTLGASGATYTAPADGYVLFVVNLGTFISISADQLRVFSPGVGTDSQWYSVFCPVRKNKTFVVSYGGSIVKQFFRFVYAEGAQ